MLHPSDLLHLPYTPDLTEAGIAYALRSLPHTYDRMGGSPVERMRRIASGKAVELALRRDLQARQVPYDNRGATPFTDPDQYDLAIGGQRCDLKSFHFFERERIRQLRRDPKLLLDAAALVPADQAQGSSLDEEDLYLFAFLFGLFAANPEQELQAQAAGQPVYLVHALPPHWNQPPVWKSLGKLALKAEAGPRLHLELGGQDQNRGFFTEVIHLPIGRRTPVSQDFYALAYLQAARRPAARVGVYSPRLQETYLVGPDEWHNLWVYGMEVILAGYMPRGEFLRRARYLPAGSRVLQYRRTRTPNLALPISELYPLPQLYSQFQTS